MIHILEKVQRFLKEISQISPWKLDRLSNDLIMLKSLANKGMLAMGTCIVRSWRKGCFHRMYACAFRCLFSLSGNGQRDTYCSHISQRQSRRQPFVHSIMLPSLVAKAVFCLPLIKIKSSQFKSRQHRTKGRRETGTCELSCHSQTCSPVCGERATGIFLLTCHAAWMKAVTQTPARLLTSLQLEPPQSVRLW